MTTDTTVLQDDLRELLTILGMSDHARPESPHNVFQEALGVLRKRLVQGTVEEPPDALKTAIWQATLPFQDELRSTGGVTFMGMRNAIARAVLTYPRRPFNIDTRAQAAVLDDLPQSVAQEAGEFYENAGAGKIIKKREAMAVAWRGVLRPYLIGLRDHSDMQARPEAGDPLADTEFWAGIAGEAIDALDACAGDDEEGWDRQQHTEDEAARIRAKYRGRRP